MIPQEPTASRAGGGKLAAVLIVGIAGAGCTVGPDYEPPTIVAPVSFAGVDGQIGREDARYTLQRWWRTLDDETLDGLIGLAAAGNLDLDEAAARVLESRYLRAAESGELLPLIDGTAAYTRSRTSENLLGGGGGGGGGAGGESGGGFALEGDAFEAGVSASWEIDVFGRLRRAVEAADADFEAEVEDFRAVFVTLAADVGTRYVRVRELQSRLNVAAENAEIQQRALALARARFETGLSSTLEVAEAEANLGLTLSTIPDLRASLREEKNRLAVLTGQVPGALDEMLALPGEPVNADVERAEAALRRREADVPATDEMDGEDVAVEGALIPSPPEQILVGIPAEMLRRRPDLRRAERELAAATARVGVARADLYPRFRLLGSFGFASEDGGDLIEWDSRTFSIGPSVSWPIFQGGRLRSLVGAAGARQEQALIAYERAILVAYEEVAGAMTNLAQQRERLAVLTEAERAAREAVSTAETQYVEGLVDFNRVIDSQQTLFEIEDQRVTSAASVTAALIDLYRALGGGWPVPEVAPGLPEPPPERAAPDLYFPPSGLNQVRDGEGGYDTGDERIGGVDEIDLDDDAAVDGVIGGGRGDNGGGVRGGSEVQR